MKSLLAALSIVLCASGCSAFDNLATAPRYDPYTLYLRNGMPVRARTEMLDRYACLSGAALQCRCYSRLAESCDCQC